MTRIRDVQPCHVTWRGIALAVTYERDWLVMDELRYQAAHLTIRAADRSPLPFTETGFQSRFLAPAEVEAAGGPAAYVLAWPGRGSAVAAMAGARSSGRAAYVVLNQPGFLVLDCPCNAVATGTKSRRFSPGIRAKPVD
jgi:hypothetical protein